MMANQKIQPSIITSYDIYDFFIYPNSQYSLIVLFPALPYIKLLRDKDLTKTFLH